MKYIYLLAILLSILPGKAQVVSRDTSKAKVENMEGEYLIDNNKLANFKYHNYLLSENTEVDIYAQKFTEMQNGHNKYAIEINGHISHNAGFSSTTEFISTYIVEDEIDKAIHALQYIKDTLLPVTPKHEIFYIMNLKQSDLKISAFYNLTDKTDWDITLWLDRYKNSSELTIKPKDVADLLKVFIQAKEKIKGMK